jgi:D-xylose transport system substrate-binding protein
MKAKIMIKRSVLGLLAGCLVLCLSGSPPAHGRAGKQSKIVIGVSFAEFGAERWSREKDKMIALARRDGAAELIYQVANFDTALQNSQIENLVTQGVDIIIIIPVDGEACVTMVDYAAKAGVPCIAYDRLIKSPNLAAYITFDNVEVGRQQALGVLDVIRKGKFALIGGSPTDNNAHLVRKGQLEVLRPLIAGGDIKIVGDPFIDDWSQEKAVTIMENILTANQNKVDAVVASNDGTGLGSLEALAAVGLAGKVPVSGQDATLAACKSIVEGKFTVTVFKDINLLAPMAVETALKLARKQPSGLQKKSLADLTGDPNAKGEIPCAFLKVTRVTKHNIYDVVIKNHFQPYDEVYKDIPLNKRPPKP